jgi:hypothetical protein
VLGRSFEYNTQSQSGRILSGPRIVRDSRTGDVVSVVERRADGVAGARGPSCLIFSTDAGFTRVWHYPRGWQRLNDDELIALTERWRRPQSA